MTHNSLFEKTVKRDSQRSKVYKWEKEIVKTSIGRISIDQDQVDKIVKLCIELYPLPLPEIKFLNRTRRLGGACYLPVDNRIEFYPHSNYLQTILHEFSHAVQFFQYRHIITVGGKYQWRRWRNVNQKKFPAWHGFTFLDPYLNLLKYVGGVDGCAFTRLVGELKRRGIRYTFNDLGAEKKDISFLTTKEKYTILGI